MKKTLSILLSLTMMTGLCACNNKPAEDVSYTITIPGGYDYQKNDTCDEWRSEDYEETQANIAVYDVGFNDYTNDTLPATVDEWIEKEQKDEKGLVVESILFDYKDGDKYEECSTITKYIYSEGSTTYNLAKLADTTENIDVEQSKTDSDKTESDFPETIEMYSARKVIIDKADRSKVIIVSASSDDAADVEVFKEVIASFNWK